MLTPRERYVQTLTFGNRPDRIYYDFGNPRESTMEAWYLQGLPRMPDAGGHNPVVEFARFVGMDSVRTEYLPAVNTGILPPFEVQTLEENEHGRVWRDSLGIVMLDAGDRLTTPGFRTRSYISHPVKNRDDWLRMRERYDAETPERYPQDWDQLITRYRALEHPVTLRVGGLFWKARDWAGFWNLCTMFHDSPNLVHEMMEHITCFNIQVLHRMLHDVHVDAVIINEDMAYNHASMISPAMFREFMLPRYVRMVSFFKEHGVKIIMVDSDGHVGQLLPLWIEAGITATYPVEIAAHNDPIVYRQKYGRAMAFVGGIDKREIRSKEGTFVEVMRKVPWLIMQGGYLPSVDHAVPPDVPLRSYLYMCELIKAIAEGRPVPGPDARLEIEESLGPIQRMWAPDLATDHD